MCQRLRITLRSETKPLSLFWRKALGLWIFDNSNVDVCEIQWWFLLKRKTKPLPLFWRRRWVFEFLTSVMLMCVKYNDDSCWKENKTSSTLWKKALGRGVQQSWSKCPKDTHWLSWWRLWQNDHDHLRKMMIIMIITIDTMQWEQKLLPIIIGANKRNRNCVRLEHHEQLVSVANTWILIFPDYWCILD